MGDDVGGLSNRRACKQGDVGGIRHAEQEDCGEEWQGVRGRDVPGGS